MGCRASPGEGGEGRGEEVGSAKMLTCEKDPLTVQGFKTELACGGIEKRCGSHWVAV